MNLIQEHFQHDVETGRIDYSDETHHTDTDQEDYYHGPRGIRDVESLTLLQPETKGSSGSDPKEEV